MKLCYTSIAASERQNVYVITVWASFFVQWLRLHNGDISNDQDLTVHLQNIMRKLGDTLSDTMQPFHVTSEIFVRMLSFNSTEVRFIPCSLVWRAEEILQRRRANFMLLLSVSFNAQIMKSVISNRHSVVYNSISYEVPVARVERYYRYRTEYLCLLSWYACIAEM